MCGSNRVHCSRNTHTRNTNLPGVYYEENIYYDDLEFILFAELSSFLYRHESWFLFGDVFVPCKQK